MNSLATDLSSKITDRIARVAVIGLGYVGLPLALLAGEKGFSATGLDIDPDKINKLNRGETYIAHISGTRIASQIENGRFVPSDDFACIADQEIIIICVPTPITDNREPDLRFVVSTVQSIAPHLRPGQLVVLESTTYPGTTREVVKPILESGGLRAGEDFFLAYSPEREDPGNPSFDTAAIPKVVGGDGEDARDLAVHFYDQIVDATVPVSSTDLAEAVKLTENIFRAVNIALVNELKQVYDGLGIDIWEVIDAAKTKPFGFMPFYPGPGLGGHCIPIDPFYLSWRARQAGMEARFIELAGDVNHAMPAYVVDRLTDAIGTDHPNRLEGLRVLIIGLAYKKNVDDTRESPALRLIELVEADGATVDYYDPFVPQIPMTRDHAPLAGRQSVEWQLDQFSKYDAALICTDHDGIDYDALVDAVPLVVDTRNATRDVTVGREKIVKA